MIFAILFFCSAAAADSSGTCGNQLTWTLDGDGLLTISGTGEMYDYRIFFINEYQYTYYIFRKEFWKSARNPS